MGIESISPRPKNVTSIDLLPEPLKKVRGQASKLLVSMLASMFDNADDALFELADKAEDSAERTMYFDSMRAVRIKREAMEKYFASAFQENFKLFYYSSSAQQSLQDAVTQSSESLSLMGADDLEEGVAVRGMVSKVNNLFADSLQQLTQRMDSLVNNLTVDETNNPLGPRKLSEIFQQACQELELNIRAKLVVFKLFEKVVLSELEELYSWSNQSLVESGVLPQIKPPRVKQSKAGEASEKASLDGAGHSEETEEDHKNEVFSLLRELLANKSRQSHIPSDYLPVAESGPVLSPAELVDMLSAVQHQCAVIGGQPALQAESIDVREALHHLVGSDGSNRPQAVDRVDDDSINLVSMLFEYILDDHSLPMPMKALLGRLQIPMLKVALLDKTFFSRGAHPARKLLNELAKAALSWNEPADVERDALFNKVRAVVDSVLNEFDNDVGVFAPLLDDFGQFVAAERCKADLIERRTRDAEQGLGMTQRARVEVGKLINDKAAGKRLPRAVVSIFREGWANYLFLLFVKQGTDNDAWKKGVQVVDDLIWSVSSDAGFGHRSELLKMIPSLLQRLREGLNTISFSKSRMRELFSDLEDIHMECLRSKPEAAQGVAAAQQDEVTVDTSTVADQQSEDAASTSSDSSAAGAIIVGTPVLESLDTLDEPGQDDNEFPTIVDSMVVGAWVEFTGKGVETTRCKLAAIIRASGKYIFVNRVGIKVAEYTRSSLINAATQGRISMLDNALLFDRALESVIGHLREMKD